MSSFPFSVVRLFNLSNPTSLFVFHITFDAYIWKIHQCGDASIVVRIFHPVIEWSSQGAYQVLVNKQTFDVAFKVFGHFEEIKHELFLFIIKGSRIILCIRTIDNFVSFIYQQVFISVLLVNGFSFLGWVMMSALVSS